MDTRRKTLKAFTFIDIVSNPFSNNLQESKIIQMLKIGGFCPRMTNDF